MKKALKLFLFLIISLLFSINTVIGEDYSSGDETYEKLGSGNWYTYYVGIRVSIVNKTATGIASKKSLIFVNETVSKKIKDLTCHAFNVSKVSLPGTYGDHYDPCSKHQNEIVKFVDLPERWKKDDEFFNMYNFLKGSDNSYEMLKKIVNEFEVPIEQNDYITVEPMVNIKINDKSYFATAFEFANFYASDEGLMNFKYTSVFAGSVSNPDKGLLYHTIFLNENVDDLNLKVCAPTELEDRLTCFSSQTGGRGIGVFSPDEINPPKKNKITINKVDENGNSIIGARIGICTTQDCKGSMEQQFFSRTSSKEVYLDDGTYYIRELSAPTGYTLSNSLIYKNEISLQSLSTEQAVFEISLPADANSTYTIVNQKSSQQENPLSCEQALDNLGENPTPIQLIDLYNKYKNGEDTNNPNVENLLNFNNPSCTAPTCKSKIELGCLSAKTTFNADDLSCFDKTITPLNTQYDIYTTFCKQDIRVENNLFGTKEFWGIAGQPLIKQINTDYLTWNYKSNNKIYQLSNSDIYVAKSYAGVVCYSLDSAHPEGVTTDYTLTVRFGDNDGDGIADLLTSVDLINGEEYRFNDPVDLTNATWKTNYSSVNDSTLYKHSLKSSYGHKLKQVFFDDLSGKPTSKNSNTKIYGIFSKFYSENSSGYIPFSVVINSKQYVTKNSCKYYVENGITTKDKLNLEFRIIDTLKPFNRDTNTNWCYIDDNGNKDCTSNNSTVQENITNSNVNNSYNKTGDGPKYKIKLTPTDILKIREYNSENPYDDYKIVKYTKNGNQIIRNAFLYSLENGVLNTYKNNNKNSIDKSYGILVNKLLVN